MSKQFSGPTRRSSLLALLGLTGLPKISLAQDWPGDLPPQVLLTRVPFFAQEDHECGPAALAMVLRRVRVGQHVGDERAGLFVVGQRDGAVAHRHRQLAARARALHPPTGLERP